MIQSDKPIKRTYTFKGITYEIIEEPQRANQLLVDFLHCEEKKDWITIKNRITNGTMWGWLKEVEVKEDEQGFW
jgi:hypothetical protein